MYALKPISPAGIPAALAKAERYRLLNEPHEAESICRDILEADPANQQARISLVLALTDQIPHDGGAFSNALSAATLLESEYDRAYYSGIAWERRSKATHESCGQGCRTYVYDWMVRALALFEDAERLSPAGNDDAVLRWNTCVRFLARHKELGPHEEELAAAILSE